MTEGGGGGGCLEGKNGREGEERVVSRVRPHPLSINQNISTSSEGERDIIYGEKNIEEEIWEVLNSDYRG